MSNRYQTIIVSSNPRGRFETVILSGTPKPGTCMSLKASTEPVNGRFTYEAFNGDADGDRLEVCVLIEDLNQGKTVTDAGVAGDYREVYFPEPGDFLQMLVANIAGTGDTFAIGDRMIIDDGTGKLIDTTGSPEREPFRIAETESTALTADTLVLCTYTGG